MARLVAAGPKQRRKSQQPCWGAVLHVTTQLRGLPADRTLT
jgi:hypothetical protein